MRCNRRTTRTPIVNGPTSPQLFSDGDGEGGLDGTGVGVVGDGVSVGVGGAERDFGVKLPTPGTYEG
jgi:hypothetical protein